jgi:hypothetical protein
MFPLKCRTWDTPKDVGFATKFGYTRTSSMFPNLTFKEQSLQNSKNTRNKKQGTRNKEQGTTIPLDEGKLSYICDYSSTLFKTHQGMDKQSIPSLKESSMPCYLKRTTCLKNQVIVSCELVLITYHTKVEVYDIQSSSQSVVILQTHPKFIYYFAAISPKCNESA